MLDHLLKENALDRFVDATYVGRAEAMESKRPGEGEDGGERGEEFHLEFSGQVGVGLG
jgi:hypothetical protein